MVICSVLSVSSVLILILLEVTQIFIVNKGELHTFYVLILILLEVTQIYDCCNNKYQCASLNPYSTGSNSNKFKKVHKSHKMS